MSEVRHESPREFDGAELGAIAHLYRGEVYRSTLWRTRLDTTTNWSVVTLGVALSITYSSPSASPLPLVLVGVLIFFFLSLEARRYRYFNVWRARCRYLETHLYVPLLRGREPHPNEVWREVLADDYDHPRYHIGFMTAVGRRIRRNYLWILLIQSAAYGGKIVVHPTPMTSVPELWERTAIGPVPGQLVLLAGALYVVTWIGVAIWSERSDSRKFRDRPASSGMG